jgi:Rps23 Pro-64 3,4-dihydroxylase Tpa1-like proline 4-hydroxylase
VDTLKLNGFMGGAKTDSFEKNVLMGQAMNNNNEKFAVESGPGNLIYIRGTRINLDELVDSQLSNKGFIKTQQQQMLSAKPFQHIVTQDWFNPTLLELVYEEFDLNENRNWRKVYSTYQSAHRSQNNTELGPASNLYFNIVNSGWFLNILTQITNVNDLLPDPMLYGGGFHESKRGDGFGVHTDFTCHPNNGLRNEMVYITYLNKNWDPSWSGALELWDSDSKQCIQKVEPEFGRSILMRNGNVNFHGHPTPLNSPPDQVRRSIASYYYTNPWAKEMLQQRATNHYLLPEQLIFPEDTSSFTQAKKRMRMFVPPILWDALSKITRR